MHFVKSLFKGLAIISKILSDSCILIFFIARISSNPKILYVLFIIIFPQFWKSVNFIVKSLI